MFSVYKITNLINKKIYIGSSNNPERRWKEHKANSKNKNSIAYNYPLYRAFRKYGVKNFYFEIIATNFKNRYEMEEYEKQQIQKYQSDKQGYNQSSETHNALSDEQIRDSLKTKVVAINIDDLSQTIFNSISEAAIALNTDRGSIHACIRGDKRHSKIKNYIIRKIDENNNIIEPPSLSTSEIIEEYNKTNPIINGERHNISEWCKIYNISKTSFYKRIKKGMNVIEAITLPKRR